VQNRVIFPKSLVDHIGAELPHLIDRNVFWHVFKRCLRLQTGHRSDFSPSTTA